MAIELCSDASPRFSFSRDPGQTDSHPLDSNGNSRFDSLLLDSNFDFEFNIHEHESTSADELFSGGQILPKQIQEKPIPPKPHHDCVNRPLLSLPPRPEGNSKKEKPKKMTMADSETEEKAQSKSFWSFRRSTSLNGEKKTSLLCSLQILSRSKSTGSVSNLKEKSKKSSHKLPLIPMERPPSDHSFYAYHKQKKTPLKKNYGHGGYISPVLNVPPPYISKNTANLFGLGSFFSNEKDKKSKTRNFVTGEKNL